MTIALGFISPGRLTIIRLATFDAAAWGLIVALALAVAGLAIDAGAGLPVGTVAIWLASLSFMIVANIFCREICYVKAKV